MTGLVVLLRGINVGRHNRVGMAALRELLGGLGYTGVRTHLQSGNAVLASADAPAAVARAIEERIEQRLGLAIDVIVRTGEELAEVVAADTLGRVATDPKKHLVVFLAEPPDAAALRELEEADFAPEELRVGDRELYAWCPGGVHASRLMKAVTTARVAPSATARNWSTVTRLLAMVADEAG